MKNLWKVSFDAKYTGLGQLLPESIKIVASGDGLKAVASARRRIIGKTFEDGPFDGTYVTRKCRWVKLVGLELITSIDA